jgi:hypothetical protein
VMLQFWLNRMKLCRSAIFAAKHPERTA